MFTLVYLGHIWLILCVDFEDSAQPWGTEGICNLFLVQPLCRMQKKYMTLDVFLTL